MDYVYLAESLASLTGLPVRLYTAGRFTHLYHHTRFKPDLAITEEENIFRNSGNVSYYMDENFLYYGLFRSKREGIALVIGPVAQTAVDHGLAVRILRRTGGPDIGGVRAPLPNLAPSDSAIVDEAAGMIAAAMAKLA